jgi:gliding motility-associated-like protein
MRNFILYIILTTALISEAQVNLVPNGSFEDYKLQPTTFLPFFKDAQYLQIENILPGWKAPTNGTSDVFMIKNPKLSNDAVDYPIRWDRTSGTYDQFEYVYPSKGSNFVGLGSALIIGNMSQIKLVRQEFIQSKFSTQLNTNSKYRLEIDHRISQSSNSSYPKLGIHFSEDSISNYYTTSINNPNFTRFVPPIVDYTNLNMSDTFWQTYSMEFRPNNAFRHLTIGCFNLEFHPFTNDTSFSAYYFIDNVSLIEIPCLVGQDTACEDEQVTYYSTFAGPYEWWYKNKLVSSDSIFTFKADEGWYYLKTPNGEDSLYLTVLDEFTDIDDISDTLCPGEVLEIDLPNNYTYLWENGSSSSSRIFSLPISEQVIISSIHCKDSVSVNLEYFLVPTGVGYSEYTFCKDSISSVEVNLFADNLFWSDGKKGSKRSFDQSGNYGYEIIDSNGCSGIGDVNIIEQCPSKYFIPNAFAPNGVNKVFRPYLSNILEAELIIYNRWGEKIYTEKSSNPTWNGMYQGAPCSTGIYFYTLEIIGSDNKKEYLKGNIHLLR